MNIHSLAKTTPFTRQLIVERVIQLHQPPAAVAANFGISVRTVFKWLRRFRAEGLPGLLDRSSRPRRSPARLPAGRIARALALARSTVALWLARLGLRRLSRTPSAPVQRYEHPQPGALLHLDCKQLGRIEAAGHRVTGDRSRRSRGAGWERMHVCVDDHSRVACCRILPDETGHSAAAFLRLCVAQFRAWGVEARAVLSDNGSGYRSREFKAACAELGLRQRFTRPYRPQTNGKAERFIRTALEECLYAASFDSGAQRETALQAWLEVYNHSRPHSSLGQRPPFSRMPEQ